jgi:hypothetical protein
LGLQGRWDLTKSGTRAKKKLGGPLRGAPVLVESHSGWANGWWLDTGACTAVLLTPGANGEPEGGNYVFEGWPGVLGTITATDRDMDRGFVRPQQFVLLSGCKY